MPEQPTSMGPQDRRGVQVYVSQVLEALSMQFQSDSMPMHELPCTLFTKDGWSGGTRSLPAFDRIESGVYQAVPAFDTAIEVLLSNHWVSTRDVGLIYLKNLVHGYIKRTPCLRMNDAVFEETFRECERLAIRGTVRRFMLAPLLNFESSVGEINLPLGLSLRPLTYENKSDMWRILQFSGFSIQYLAECNWAIWAEGEVKSEENKPNALRNRTDSLIPCITALRLLRPEYVGANAVVLGESSPLDIRAACSLDNKLSLPDRGSTSLLPKYYLTESEVEKLPRLVDLLMSKNAQAKAWFPLSRFNLSYSRASAADALLDIVIALEGLLVPDGAPELALRLATRGTVFLSGRTPGHQSFTLLRKVYQFRNKLVHKGQVPDEVGLVLMDAVPLTRDIILRLLPELETKSLEEICEGLDDGLARVLDGL